MRRESKRRAAQVRIYRKRRDAFLTEHDHCEFPLGCDYPTPVVLHHRAGRQGARLLDERYWAASCRFHNDYAETSTGESRLIGWLLPVFSEIPEDAA